MLSYRPRLRIAERMQNHGHAAVRCILNLGRESPWSSRTHVQDEQRRYLLHLENWKSDQHQHRSRKRNCQHSILQGQRRRFQDRHRKSAQYRRFKCRRRPWRHTGHVWQHLRQQPRNRAAKLKASRGDPLARFDREGVRLRVPTAQNRRPPPATCRHSLACGLEPCPTLPCGYAPYAAVILLWTTMLSYGLRPRIAEPMQNHTSAGCPMLQGRTPIDRS